MGIVQAAIAREENSDLHFDPDVEGAEAPERPFLLLHAAVIGVAMTLVVFVEMLCVAKVRIGTHPDRFALLTFESSLKNIFGMEEC